MFRRRRDNRPGERTSRLGLVGGDTVDLVVAYVKQETLEPLRGLGRFVVFGAVGSVALATGFVLGEIGLLRVLQGETGGTFSGNLSWLPYVLTALVGIGVAGGSAVAIGRGQARRTLRHDEEAK